MWESCSGGTQHKKDKTIPSQSFPMRLSLFLLALLLTGLSYAQEGDASLPDNSDSGVNPNTPLMGGEGEEVDEEGDTTGVDPALQAQQEREAQQQQLQQFYVQFLLKRGSATCKSELEKVLQTPPEESQTTSPFSKECDKEFKGVSFFFFSGLSRFLFVDTDSVASSFSLTFHLLPTHIIIFFALAPKKVPIIPKQG